jgi:predicted ATPase
MEAPFLLEVSSVPERLDGRDAFPFQLPFVRGLRLTFEKAVTFFVGENGSGKSTMLEAIAALSGLPAAGGSRNELGGPHTPEETTGLAPALRPSFRRKPRDGFFLRAEFHAYFATLLDARDRDPDFKGDPYARVGGKSLHAQSHGESFLALLQHRVQGGLILLDEPESALSPQRQLTLLALMASLLEQGGVQFIVATHSPILLAYPGARIYDFDAVPVTAVGYDDLTHVALTKSFLNDPGRFLRRLLPPEPGST